MMKKLLALLLCLLMVATGASALAEEAGRTAAAYTYVLTEDDVPYVENLIFGSDVVISGDNAQIMFVNCEFTGDIILTADSGTRVFLLGCDVSGACVFRNSVQEADLIAYSFPKFMSDTPLTGVAEDCIGALIGLGDVVMTFNGTDYTIADSDFFLTSDDQGIALEAYAGQEANYLCVVQRWENGQQLVELIAEYAPEE